MKMQTILSFVKRYPTYSSFFIVFGIVLFLNLSHPRPFIYYFDSGNYWSLSDDFVKQGNFSLANFDDALRGYLFPLIIFVVKRFASLIGFSEYLIYEVIMSLVCTLFLTVWVPGVIELLFNKKIRFPQSIVFSLLVLYFWRGLFFYPLSDLLAFLFLLLGIYIILNFQKYGWSAMFAGIFWGGSAIIRPIYQITLIPLLLWVVYYYYKEIYCNARTIFLRSIAIFVGLIIVFFPQILINSTHFSTYSPFVQTQTDGSNLFIQQLGWGIVVQKYETNIGADYPGSPVIFLDRQGESVLVEAGYKATPYRESGTIFSDKLITFGEYLLLVSKYPLDFLSIYLRHLFNGLDIVYNTVYINDVYDSALPMRLANYSLWFLVVVFLSINLPKLNARSVSASQAFIPVIFSLTCIVAIPTAIEVRFMLPVHLMAYALMAFWILPDFIETIFAEKKNMFTKHIFGYIFFVALCFLLSANTYTGLQFGSYVLNRVLKNTPSISESEILNKIGPIKIPGDESLFVDSNPLLVETGRYYRIRFDLNSPESTPKLFYVDFYGGAEYDFVGQDKYFMVKRGNHSYDVVIYSGNKTLPPQVFFRIVSISSSSLIITNLKVDILQK